MQAQIHKDSDGLFDSLAATISAYQTQWNSDTTLCPMGLLRPAQSKHLLSL